MNIDSARLDAALRAWGLTGASFAYWDGVTLRTAVAGLRNCITGDPVTTDTLLHIGSITKVVNAALMLQLADDGLIGLDDSIRGHMPDLVLRNAGAQDRITCRMLIDHRSGIDGDWLADDGPDTHRIVDAV